MDDEDAFKEYTKWVREMFRDHPVLGEKLKRYGTAGIVNTTNARNILPTHNFKYGHFTTPCRSPASGWRTTS